MNGYLRLMRVDRPIGSWLLLWPTLWALWLASGGLPDLRLLATFVCGVALMRSAGCVVNDYFDRNIDGRVRRTASRPFPCGDVSGKGALMLLLLLLILSFGLVITLNQRAVWLSCFSLLLALGYPLTKRIIAVPQLILGMAYGSSVPLAFAAVQDQLPACCWLLYLSVICWVVIYDTQYAMADLEDDLKIGVKSTATLWGRTTAVWLAFLQIGALFFLLCVGLILNLSLPFYLAVAVAALLFMRQQLWLYSSSRDSSICLRAFMSNNHIGLVIFLGISLTLLNA